MQEASTDVWKENIFEDLEVESLEYEMVEEFLAEIKKEFGGEDKKNSQSSRVEEIRARRKDNGEVCSRV